MSGNFVVDHRDGVITLARLQYFDVSQANLKEEHKNWLRRNVVPLLKGNGSISIVGLSSRSGKAAFNKALSMKRANAVRSFLEECLLSCFPFDLVDGLGESLAEEMGQEDGVEDGQFFLAHGGFQDDFTAYGTKFSRRRSNRSPATMKLPPLPPLGNSSQ